MKISSILSVYLLTSSLAASALTEASVINNNNTNKNAVVVKKIDLKKEKTESNKIDFDFAHMIISAEGIYNPNIDPEKDGLEAELIARNAALGDLKSYFKNSCEGVDKSLLGVKAKWDNSFRSQGTEIFHNNYLRITLQAPFKQVLKSPGKTKKSIKAASGEKLVFILAEHVPGDAVRCGSIELLIESKTIKEKVHILPGEQILEKEINSGNNHFKLVKLIYDATKTELKPATDQDTSILEKSTLLSKENQAIGIIPVAVMVKEE